MKIYVINKWVQPFEEFTLFGVWWAGYPLEVRILICNFVFIIAKD